MVQLKLLAELTGHKDRVWQVSWHPSGHYLCSCSGDRTVRVWQLQDLDTPNFTALTPPAVPATVDNEPDVAVPSPPAGALTWRCVDVLDGVHKRTVRSVAFAPSGREIATASFDGTTGIWEPRRPLPADGGDPGPGPGYECVAPLEGHENEVKSVAWSRGGNLLATCSRDKSVWVWEVAGDGDFECLSILQEHTQDVKAVLWHPHREILASASYDDTVRLWREDDDDWYCMATLTGPTSTVWALDFNAAGDTVVGASDDRTLRFWRCERPAALLDSTATFGLRQDPGWKCVRTLKDLHTRCIYSVAWSKVHGRVASAGGDNAIVILDPTTPTAKEGTERPSVPDFEVGHRQLAAHGVSDINCVQWNPAARYATLLASAGDDGVVRIWQAEA
ncbi:Cytosolic iron-sulfur protein assembly protein [Tieghemiomyces parasiticus]|uniref:Probable cytosolic iron-sulfur protein assembly protein 1 n=1 Tax=Tieghemiomyces parasiticus TaxID=78921 RepID=A0A9W8DTD0_9FUNG|nr:Cytosolic iron-sulfur protein assembly protein [Tieghemiomyces parasiticus]